MRPTESPIGRPVGPVAESFNNLVTRLLDEIFDDHPTLASAVGVPGRDHMLPDLSEAGLTRMQVTEAAWLRCLEAIPVEELSPDDCVDRDLIVMQLRRRRILWDWSEWRRSAEYYLDPALLGVHVLLLNRPMPEGQLARAIGDRLHAFADVLACGRKNLDPGLASPLLLRRAAGQARGGAGYVEHVLPRGFPDPGCRASVRDAGETAARNLRDFAEHLEELSTVASGEWAVGSDHYDRLLTEAEGLRLTAAEVHLRGRAELDELLERFRECSLDICGDADPRALVAVMDARAPQNVQDLRRAYEEALDRARTFCRTRDLVSVGDMDSCRVEPAAPFIQAMVPVAHYFPPPALAGDRTGHLCVPQPPDDASSDVFRRCMQLNSLAVIPGIAVHEGYPGHHWHFSRSRGAAASRVRKVLTSSFFGEGWAVYAEEMLRQQGFFADPVEHAASIRGRILRATRMVIDPMLHCGELSPERAVGYVAENTGVPTELAAAEIERYCAAPTQAASYLTGALEICRVRDRYLAGRNATLRGFHDAITGTGVLPVPLAERCLLGRNQGEDGRSVQGRGETTARTMHQEPLDGAAPHG